MDEQAKAPDTPAMDQKQKDELILHLRILEDLINSMLWYRNLAIAGVILVLLLGAGFVGATLWIQNTAKDLKADMETLRNETKEAKESVSRMDDVLVSIRNQAGMSFKLGQTNGHELNRLQHRFDDMELRRLEGNWKAEKLIDAEGKLVPDAKAYKLSVNGNNSILEDAKKEKSEGKYLINTLRKPNEIDIQVTSGPNKDKTYLGVFELVGDTLRIAHDPKGEKRPEKPEPGSGHVYEEWKRAK